MLRLAAQSSTTLKVRCSASLGLGALIAQHGEEQRALGEFLMEKLYFFVGPHSQGYYTHHKNRRK